MKNIKYILKTYICNVFLKKKKKKIDPSSFNFLISEHFFFTYIIYAF